MNKTILQHYKPLLYLIVTSFLVFGLHKLILGFIDTHHFENQFIHSLEKTYLFFFLCSFIILFILIQINKKSPTNVGFMFMILTTSKMGVAYMFLKPILQSKLESASLEKINFFMVFAVFLIIETMVSIKMLNNKQ